MPRSALAPIAQVLLGAFMISFSAVWVIISDVPSTTSAFYRVFFGFIFLAIARLWTRRPLRDLNKLLIPTALCGFYFALDLYFWHESIHYVGPGLATIISNFQVFIMAACGWFLFHEQLKLRFLFSMPMAFFGLFLLIGLNWSHLPPNYHWGVLYGFATAVAYSFFLLQFRKIKLHTEERDWFSPLMLISLFTAIFLAIFMVVNGISFAIPTTATSIVSLLFLGLFSQVIGWLLIGGSLPKVPTSLTGLILLLQPSCSFIWDVIFFKRPTDAFQWLGVCIALSAIYLGLTGSAKKRIHPE